MRFEFMTNKYTNRNFRHRVCEITKNILYNVNIKTYYIYTHMMYINVNYAYIIIVI